MAAGALPALVLKPGREKSLRARHPWIFSGAIAKVDGSPASGSTIDIRGADGAFLARGAYSPSSQIRARAWTFADDTIDTDFFERRIARAAAARRPLVDAGHNAVRLLHAEADGLPGVIADRYGTAIVIQLLSAGADAWRPAFVAALGRLDGVTCVVERSDVEVRALEGLAPRAEVALGVLPDDLTIVEDGIVYRVDVVGGQKTGFYLDQRDNRRIVRTHSSGRRVLNAFCYTGGFTLAALAGGARSVLSLDTSAPALALGADNLARNPALPATNAEWREADVFAELRALRNTARQFDLIVLDPPKFAPTAAHVERAARAYKDINLLAFKLLAPGGLLATFSCSGGVPADLFQKIVAGAAQDAQAEATIVARLAASADHPVALAFPEGDYLKGLLLAKAA
jgi:23S rRNA (cytosine1962-C5)-methyltransferase